MRVVLTSRALADLNDILAYTRMHYPPLVPQVEQRIRSVLDRVAMWPESARHMKGRPGVRVALVLRYPFKISYRIEGDRIEVLRIHHTSQNLPD